MKPTGNNNNKQNNSQKTPPPADQVFFSDQSQDFHLAERSRRQRQSPRDANEKPPTPSPRQPRRPTSEEEEYFRRVIQRGARNERNTKTERYDAPEFFQLAARLEEEIEENEANFKKLEDNLVKVKKILKLRHRRRKQEVPKKVICALCCSYFGSCQSLKEHMERKHSQSRKNISQSGQTTTYSFLLTEGQKTKLQENGWAFRVNERALKVEVFPQNEEELSSQEEAARDIDVMD